MARSEKLPTFDEVDDHLIDVDLSVFQAEAARGLDPAATLARIRTGYGYIRPVLQLVAATPLVPPHWRAVLKGFLGLLDAAGG